MMNKKGWQEWEDVENRVNEGNVLPAFLFSAIKDIQLNEEDNDGPSIRKVVKAMMNSKEEALTQARLIFQQCRGSGSTARCKLVCSPTSGHSGTASRSARTSISRRTSVEKFPTKI